jgi:NAD-dependent dihydropyrimidine dehydrogenase PreA subunit
MKRKIIMIDEEKCNGCGLCATACHEGALKIIDGKARLISESYCDGLGNCLPECPTDAIRIVEREAEAFDEEAVMKRIEAGNIHSTETSTDTATTPHQAQAAAAAQHSGCPGSRARTINRSEADVPMSVSVTPAGVQHTAASEKPVSQLGQWPCQIKLVPVNAPYFDNANLLIAASCTAYAHANIHQEFMKNKITIIGCPKLDEVDYSQKLAQIFANHDLKSITVLRMEVPCCGGIVHAVKNALLTSGTMVPWNVVTISTDGSILEN